MHDLEIMQARDADAEGPPCGTDAAVTSLNITYAVGGVLQIHHSRHCCYRHIPGPEAVLPKSAVIEEVVVDDGTSRSYVPLAAIAGDIEALLAAGSLALA